MFGLDALTTSTLLVLAASSGNPQDLCPAHPPTNINVIPKTENVKYDSEKTLKELQAQDTDTVDPYGFHGTSITQAYMSGTIQPTQKVQLDYGPVKGYRAICLWYKDITIELKIDPTIFMAKELYADRCMRKALIEHELKHVKVDREVVNEYARSMGQKLLTELKSRGFTAGPVPEDKAQDVAQKMHHVVNQILELEYQKLEIDRKERQRAVDNLGEYNRVDELCPEFEKYKKKLYSDLVK